MRTGDGAVGGGSEADASSFEPRPCPRRESAPCLRGDSENFGVERAAFGRKVTRPSLASARFPHAGPHHMRHHSPRSISPPRPQLARALGVAVGEPRRLRANDGSCARRPPRPRSKRATFKKKGVFSATEIKLKCLVWSAGGGAEGPSIEELWAAAQATPKEGERAPRIGGVAWPRVGALWVRAFASARERTSTPRSCVSRTRRRERERERERETRARLSLSTSRPLCIFRYTISVCFLRVTAQRARRSRRRDRARARRRVEFLSFREPIWGRVQRVRTGCPRRQAAICVSFSVTRSFQVQFVRSIVQKTQTCPVAFQNTLNKSSPRHQSPPNSKTLT